MRSYKALKSKNIKENRGDLIEQNVEVAVEVPITIIINGRYKFNLVCTPTMLEELLVGFVMSEGICKNPKNIKEIRYLNSKIFAIEINEDIDGIRNWVEVRTSGAIGITQNNLILDDWELNNLIDSNIIITPEIIFSAQKKLRERGVIWQKSGGTHMSGLFNQEGDLLAFSEDVGRHNTLDKIIGYAIIHDINMTNSFVCTSGRLSLAMISKIVRLKIPILVSVSAPINRGLELAKKAGLTLVGFSRDPAMNIYCHPNRIKI
ncbi:MAG: formate dehydrogenase accessory sulfurtransferase FdhD [Promethearchaeota archaeon]